MAFDVKDRKKQFSLFRKVSKLRYFWLSNKGKLEKHIYTDSSHEVRDSKAMRDNKLNPPPS